MTTLIMLWIVMGTVNFFGMVTYSQKEFSSIAEDNLREDMGTVFIFSFLFPFIGPVVCFLSSGFYKHGFVWWK